MTCIPAIIYSSLIRRPTSAQYGEEHTYEITATDPDDNDIYYYIDFGDGTEETESIDLIMEDGDWKIHIDLWSK